MAGGVYIVVNGIVNMVLLQHPTDNGPTRGGGVGWGWGQRLTYMKTVVNDSSFFVAFASLVAWL